MIKRFGQNVLAVSFLALLLSSGQPVCSQAADDATKEDPLAIYRATGIDKSQEQKLSALLREFQSLTLAKGEVMIRLMNEMRAMSLQATSSEAQALAKQTEINQLHDEMSLERIKLVFRLRALLTSDQKGKLVELMARKGSP